MNSPVDNSARPLHQEELVLLSAMLKEEVSALTERLVNAKVVPMSDGAMGSVRFVSKSGERQFGGEISAAQYTDSDGVLVSISVNADDRGELYEIDLWKVNFAPLVRYPTPSLLQLNSAAAQ